MKNRILLAVFMISGLFAVSIATPVVGQTHGKTTQQQDSTKRKDPINRMHDSTQLRQSMRDSNVMKMPNQLHQDSLPTKKGWINNDSIQKKGKTI